jgi:hypothetical protein
VRRPLPASAATAFFTVGDARLETSAAALGGYSALFVAI